MKYINADGQVLGRICSYAAKQALLGEDVVVVNAEKAVISGGKDAIYKAEKAKLDIQNIGNYTKGPFHQKRPDRFVRKAIRGMLPFSNYRGRQAFEKVSVYIGVPVREIKKNHDVDVSKMKPEKLDDLRKTLRRSVTVGEVCTFIGGRW